MPNTLVGQFKRKINLNAICIQCIYSIEYLRMATLCIYSMRKNGMKEKIFLMCDEKILNDTIYWHYLKQMDVYPEVIYTGIRQRNYTEMFNRHPEIEYLLNVDCDQYFSKYKIEFDKIIDGSIFRLFHKTNWETEYAIDVYNQRKCLFFSPNKEQDIASTFHCDLKRYENSLLPSTRWVWGNLCLMSRKLLETEFWKNACKMGDIYYDDEGAYVLARYLSPIEISYFTNEEIHQTIGPISSLKIRTLFHYAGPDYKNKSEKFLKIIEQKTYD